MTYNIPEPCHESWDAMTQHEQGRHCASCDKVVVDMTAMSGDEAAHILQTSRAGSADSQQTGVCARVRVDGSGRIQLPKATRALHARLLTDGMAAMLAMSLWGCAGDTQTGSVAVEDAETMSEVLPQAVVVRDACVMGEMIIPEPPPLKPINDDLCIMGGMVAEPPQSSQLHEPIDNAMPMIKGNIVDDRHHHHAADPAVVSPRTELMGKVVHSAPVVDAPSDSDSATECGR